MTTEAGDDWTGKELGGGRYHVVSVVGQGSMGQVLRAYDRRLENEVVIKVPVFPAEAAGGRQFLQRFEREIRSLIHLTHPHVVKVIDVGEFDGRPFVVMQYLPGGSLKDRIESGPYHTARPMEPNSLGTWLLEIAKALDFLHAQGFVHRDVKPANIMFDRHGNAFLGDFGIIKSQTADPEPEVDGSLTAPGFLVGTPNYLAPEVVLGERCDGKADQYALALSAYEALSGKNFAKGSTPMATMINHTKIVPPPIFEYVPELSQRLADALNRGLAKNPEERFESCTAFAREALAGLGVETGSGTYRAPDFIDPSQQIVLEEDNGSFLDSSAATILTSKLQAGAAPKPANHRKLGWLVGSIATLALVIGGVILGRNSIGPADKPNESTKSIVPPEPDRPIEVNIAYGTEKQKWLEEALEEFKTTEAGKKIKIQLVGAGSVEGANSVLNGPGEMPLHVWSPASSVYRDVFEDDWRKAKKTKSPILSAETLALTPMVFVIWKERYEAFLKRYGKMSFETIGDAMREPKGWETIADKPEWGVFQFGHTDPNKSNSGLVTLTLMAYEFTKKSRGLTASDITSAEFQSKLTEFAKLVTRQNGTLTNSTGTLMKQMVLKGPSQFDGLVLYENLAIDAIRTAKDSWGDISVAYLEPNLWNDHPYYILDVPWSSPDQRKAAAEFLKFLMTEKIQRQALTHGFRPGNPAVKLKRGDGFFAEFAENGLRIDVPPICEPPKAEVVRGLLESYGNVER